MRLRLFALAPEASDYMLFVPAMSLATSDRAATASAYDSATGGWVGNSASGLLASGTFGRQLRDGGDGSAERRWLETAELATVTSIAGARWMWHHLRPALLLDYFAIGDDTDHLFWGLVAGDAPAQPATVVEGVQEIRARAWALVDARVAAMHALARESGAAIFLSGDHGMRAYWRLFRPNVALADAGLLAVDSAGRIMPGRSLAVSPNGYWVSVNRTAWRDGIVRPAGERAVIDSVVRVLSGIRGTDGLPVVTRIYLPSPSDSLGIGGPAGGDVYFALGQGYYYDASARGPVTSDVPPRGGHGFPSVAPDMHTVLCANGPDVTPRRLSPARTIDLAPTVLDWLGVARPTGMAGRSLMSEMR